MSSLALRSLRRLAASALLAVGCAFGTAPATAQFGGQAGFADAFQPDFLARDVSLFVEALGLEEWQRPIIETFLSDYQASFASGVEGVRQRMSGMRDQLSTTDPSEVMKKVLEPIDRWNGEKLRLRDEFLENVRSQLSDQQLERWPRFERAFRREKSLDRGELQGESVNLLLIARELQLGPREQSELATVFEEYEQRLDNALTHRQRVIEAQQPKVKEAMGNADQESGLLAMEAIMAARVVVRQAQDEGLVAIRDALRRIAGDEVASRFEEMALRRGYPKVYRTDPIIPLFENARDIPSLSPEQRTALDDLEARYVVEIAGANTALANAYRAEEPKEPRRRVALMEARQQGADAVARLRAEPDAISSARKQREELYDRYRQAIMAILNEDQQKSMPNYGKGDRIPPDEMERARRAKEEIRGARQPDGRIGVSPDPGMSRGGSGRDTGGKSREQQQLGTSAPRGTGPGDRAAPPSRTAD
jgi:hypothetical protein